MTVNPTRWVGIDLHRRRSQLAIIDEHGELTLSRRIVNDRATFRELLGGPRGTHVALEATYGWEWLAELLEEAGYDVHLAHPLRTGAIAAARMNTDAVDARTFAHLLRTGLLPEAYIAPPELRDLRDLLRDRATLVHLRASIKNRVHACSPAQASCASTQSCLAKLVASCALPWSCPMDPAGGSSGCSSRVDDLDRQIAPIERELRPIAHRSEQVRLLMSIPGIAELLGLTLLAEVGGAP